jgi:ribose-phosphate pyrophosphokinase
MDKDSMALGAAVSVIIGNCPPGLTAALSGRLSPAPKAARFTQFPDGETRVQLTPPLRGTRVFLVHGLEAPSGEHLLQLALMADAAWRAGAVELVAIIPYLGYARQDRRSCEGEPLGAAVVAGLLDRCGFDRIVTIDLHCPSIEGFFACPVENLTAGPTLAEAVRPHAKGGVVISPDFGAVKLARRYASLLGLPLAVVHKTRRGPREVTVDEVSGDVHGRLPVVVDDMISTGTTIAAALDAVIAAGAAPDAIVAATHGIFAPGSYALLASQPVRRLFVTDSVEPLASSLLVERISLANLIVDAISRLSNYASLDDLLTRA